MEHGYDAGGPARRHQAVLRSVPERRCAEGEHAAGPDLQHRRESVGSIVVVAARLRLRMCGEADAALSFPLVGFVVHRSGSAVIGSVRRVRVGSGQAGAVSAPTRTLQRYGRVAPMAGQRSAFRRGSDGRADVCHHSPFESGAHQRRSRRASVCVDERHRRRLGGEADRRVPRRGAQSA